MNFARLFPWLIQIANVAVQLAVSRVMLNAGQLVQLVNSAIIFWIATIIITMIASIWFYNQKRTLGARKLLLVLSFIIFTIIMSLLALFIGIMPLAYIT